MTKDLIEIDPSGKMIFHFHPGQVRAWDSNAKTTAIIAGTQSGKTSFGPVWLWREILLKGPGDYIVATPTFPLLEVKLLPEFKRLFEDTLKLGKYQGNPIRKFTFSDAGEIRMFRKVQDVRTNIYFGYASNPDSLESMTAKAAWLDEAGQDEFKVGSYNAIQRRLAIADGRILITSTPYNLGWLKTRIWNQQDDPDARIKVVRFDSTENPQFPQHVLETARRELPAWEFDMFYRGIFTRPAGLIYDNFDDAIHTCPRFPIPERWPRFLGTDFGGNNTAGIYLAKDPENGTFYAYKEYLTGRKTAKDHTRDMLKDENPKNVTAYGGAASEEQWRAEFTQAGLRIRKPLVSDLDVGIQRVYGGFARQELVIFDDLDGLLGEINTYSHELDDTGQPTMKIANKETFHRLDGLRYIFGSVGTDYVSTSEIFQPATPDEFDPDNDLAWAERYVTY